MPILYVARKKVDKTGDIPKELYYAVAKTVQKKGEGVHTDQIADEISLQSSLTPGDVFSTLVQLPKKIVSHLKMGRTVTIDGLGTFYIAVSSEGVESPGELTVSKIRGCRICFRPDKEMNKYLADCDFERIEADPEKPRKPKD